MHVMVTGATGFIGSHLIRVLLEQGCEVTACARNIKAVEDKFPGVRTIGIDFTSSIAPADWIVHLKGIDTVINTVGIIAETGRQTFQQLHVEFPRSLFQACKQAGVKRVIQISALGAAESAVSRYHRSKHAADTFLRTLALEKVIVKPSFVYGEGGKSTAFFRALAAQPFQVLIDQGRQQVQPLHIDDLCAALARLALADAPPAIEIEAVGPAPIRFREMLEGYRQWLGYGAASHEVAGVAASGYETSSYETSNYETGSSEKGSDEKPGRGRSRHKTRHGGHLRSISLPYLLVLGFARLAGFLKIPWVSADNIRMLQKGNTGNAAVITSLLGRAPTSFAAALRQSAATEADRWHARLYFLLPLLRFVIGFVWIFSGITSAFVYPVADSYRLLQQVGFTGWIAVVALYGAAFLDVALGLAVLLRYRIYLAGLLQLGVILAYTILISLYLPEFWFHPFGPIIKNIPFVLAILMLMAVERK